MLENLPNKNGDDKTNIIEGRELCQTFVCDMWNVADIKLYKAETEKETAEELTVLGTLGPVKVVYCVLALLIFLIPAKQFRGTADRLVKCIIIIALTAGILLITRLPDIVSRIDGGEFAATDPYYDLGFIINSPFRFLRMLLLSLWTEGQTYVFEAVGRYLAGRSIRTGFWWLRLYLSVLLIHAIWQQKRPIINLKQRGVLLGVSAILVICIMTTMTLTYTHYGENMIRGVHGRYFIPIFAPVLYSLATDRIPVKFQKKYLTSLIWFVYLGVIFEVMSQVAF